MGVDYFLIGIIAIVCAILFVSNVYILVYFQHEDDKNTAWFPKVLIIFGLFFAEAVILMYPLDVANNTSAIGCKEGWNPACGNLDMELLWIIVFMALIFFIAVLVPFAIYYYEEEDDVLSMKRSRLWEALKLEIGTLALIGSLFVIGFVFVSKSYLPMRAMEVESNSNTSGFQPYTDGALLSITEVQNAKKQNLLSIHVILDISFPIFITAAISFLGWFGFAIFCGIGLVSLPVDLILSYCYRPQFIPADVYAHQKLRLQRLSVELLEIGQNLKASMEKSATTSSRNDRRRQKKVDFVTLNKFKQSVYLLENDMEELKMCHEDFRNYNPLVSLIQLILGCIASVLSLAWVLHIGLYMLPTQPIFAFLNSYFIWFDYWFPLFGTISVGVFSFYLLLCAVKGCFKFGMRCFCFSLHPMVLHGTYMNSMLFNLGLVLSCCIPCVQFSDQAFQEYGRLTSLRSIMGVQIRYLEYLSVIYKHNIFVFSMLGFAALTAIYLILHPKDKSSPIDEIRQKIDKEVRASRAEGKKKSKK